MDHRLSTRLAAALVWMTSVVAMMGCHEQTPEPEPARGTERPHSGKPLQPLVYTEDPDLTAEAAAVRERRLTRQLLEGADAYGNWGTLQTESRKPLPELKTADALGEALFRALIERDEALWEHVFVEPRAYAGLVRLDLEAAREFVDRQKGASLEAREAFAIERASEAPRGGLGSVFTYEGMELGKGRTVDGTVVESDEGDDESSADAGVSQHWNNVLKIGLKDDDVVFEVSIRKILRTREYGGDGAASSSLGLAAGVDIGRKLELFLEAGLHLKPELLRAMEYPYPLAVGNYWRYRRKMKSEATDEENADGSPGSDDPAAAGRGSEQLDATEVVTRVASVKRYGTRRLVHLIRSYNDADLTTRHVYWMMTPRRIYRCPRACQRRVDDLDWVLRYLNRQTDIYRFPIEQGKAWPTDDPTYRVEAAWETVETQAGAFFGTLPIIGQGPLGRRVPQYGPPHRVQKLTRLFAPGKGIVRRDWRVQVDGEARDVVEELIDYRIMPQ